MNNTVSQSDIFISSHDGRIYRSMIHNSYQILQDPSGNKYVRMSIITNGSRHYTFFDYEDMYKLELNRILWRGSGKHILGTNNEELRINKKYNSHEPDKEKTKYFMHHNIMGINDNNMIIHINGNTYDNRKINLKMKDN
jgi:hypothetical protein